MDAIQRMRDKAQGHRSTGVQPATESADAGDREQRSDRDRAGKSGSGLRAFIQPDSCLRRTGLSVSANLLSAFNGSSDRSQCDLVRRRYGDGAAWGGGWGWGAGWGGGDIDVNVNNNFNRNTNISGGNRVNNISGNRGGGSGNTIRHIAVALLTATEIRQTVLAEVREAILRNRQRAAQRDIGRQGGNLRSKTVIAVDW